MKYPNIINAVFNTPWAIEPAKLQAIAEVVRLRAEGITFTEQEIEARVGAARKPSPAGAGSVAVIPVLGMIQQRANLMSQFSGGTSTEKLSKQIRQAAGDTNIKAIVLDVDSPGGGVSGVDELSAEIHKAREQKHIVAVCNSLMASAAYWVGSAASEVAITPGGSIGSIGIYTIHEDLSRAYDQAGITPTIISAGKHKVDGNDLEPLSKEARAFMQARVDEYYAMFVAAVARNRGVSASAVRGGFGQGRVVGAKEAIELGMADRVATLDQVLADLGATAAKPGPRAEGERVHRAETEPDSQANDDTPTGEDAAKGATPRRNRARRALVVLEAS